MYESDKCKMEKYHRQLTALFVLLNQLLLVPEYFMTSPEQTFIPVVIIFLLIDILALIVSSLERCDKRQRLLEFTTLLIILQMQLRVIYESHQGELKIQRIIDIIVMISIRSFLALTLFRATFERNCLNFSCLCFLFCGYWISIILAASSVSKTHLARWFTISNVLSILTTISIFVVFNRAVGSGFNAFLDESLVEKSENVCDTLDLIDDAVIVINNVAE